MIPRANQTIMAAIAAKQKTSAEILRREAVSLTWVKVETAKEGDASISLFGISRVRLGLWTVRTDGNSGSIVVRPTDTGTVRMCRSQYEGVSSHCRIHP